MNQPLQNLQQMIECISALASDKENDRVSMEMVVEAIGNRSFGPMLMLIGMTLFSPLSGVPGMSFFMAAFVLLVAVQMLIGRKTFWLPAFILDRSVERGKLQKALTWLEKPARGIDKVLKPRLTFLVRRKGSYAVAVLCVVVGLVMPFMELLPFSSSVAGLALLALGVALVVQDGLLVLLALALFGGVFSVLGMRLLG